MQRIDGRRGGAVGIMLLLGLVACTPGAATTAEREIDAAAAARTATIQPSPPVTATEPSPTTAATTATEVTPVPTATTATTATTVIAATTAPATTTPGTVAPAPDVDAAAYAVYDATTDRWLGERDADTVRPVGSIMKLLTAHVVMQVGDPAHLVTVPPMTLDGEESAIGLYPGERQRRDVLLRAMLIVSANDAARALAIDIAGTEDAFAVRMNEAATALDLHGTRAANAVGLDAPGAGSTARDAVRLANVLLQDESFRATAVRRTATLHGQTFPATNDLLGSYPGATGVKSGRTTGAGWCLVGSAERAGRTVVVAVLGASSDAARLASTTALLDWAFAHP